MSLISVVIPIYNSQEYLSQCIESVLKQKFTNFELILVNDGSKDGSGVICDKFAQQDSRIQVKHKENEGVGRARNYGIKKAKGEFICFIDSDDYVNEKYLLDLYNAYEENQKVDLVVHGVTKIAKDSKENIDLGNFLVQRKETHTLFEDLKVHNFGFPFAKLFKANIIKANNLSFPENYSLAEDLAFLLKYINYTQFILFQDFHNYYYRQIDNSLSNRVREPNVYLNRYLDLKHIYKEFYPQIHKRIFESTDYQISLQKTFGQMIFINILSLYLHKLSRKDRLRYLEIISKDSKSILKVYLPNFNNPIFKVSIIFLLRNQYAYTDLILNTFFKMRRFTFTILNKPLPYKIKK